MRHQAGNMSGRRSVLWIALILSCVWAKIAGKGGHDTYFRLIVAGGPGLAFETWE
jgi:hypothetical protein